jgi:hypothetical protein
MPGGAEAEASHLPEFKSIARGIQQDKAAVLAGLTLPCRNGPSVGHVKRLKLLKRSMYGRAKLPRLARACASCGWISPAFSRRPACCRLRCPTSHGEEVQDRRAEAAGWRRRTTHDKGRRTMRMSLDIDEAVFDEQAPAWRRKPCAMKRL